MAKKKKLLNRLQLHYRLVILNEDTLEEKASFKLRPLNVFVSVGLTVILLIVGTILLVAFTPLREYIPGYADVNMKLGRAGLPRAGCVVVRTRRRADEPARQRWCVRR
jgi:hypothetical protein